ncbi:MULTISPECIES: dynamin family protein [Gordonia]|nr:MULTISPECIES: dynamin family protein [Gordonia]MBD0021243.1 dynamin family protein [Gordonia sp. (in: high G+C Gram-positive bacteria)]
MTKPAAGTTVDTLVAAQDSLRKRDKIAEADRIAEVAGREPPTRTLVIVGEIKRGKSSLVNSLIGRSDLAKVDTKIATSAQVRYIPTGVDTPDGWAALILPDGRRHPIPAGEVLDWVTVDGVHAADDIDGVIPIGAEIAVDAVHLAGTVIVDTPGVNGLNPQHVQATVTATEGACALVMVCDALAPISAAELEFLRGVTAEIGTVILAVTKKDKALREWRTVIEENRRLLAQHASQFAGIPVLGVSNAFALRAISIGDTDRAASAWTSSGVPDLGQVINTALGDPKRIVRRNAIQCAQVALGQLRGELEAQKLAIVDAPKTHREMTEEKARLEELQAAQKEWGTRLTQRKDRLQHETNAQLRKYADELKTRWEEQIESMGAVALNNQSRSVVADISVEVETTFVGIARRLQEELTAIAVDMVGEAQVQAGPMATALSGFDDIDLRPPKEYERWKGFFDPHLVTMGAMGLAGGGGVSTAAAGLVGVAGAAAGAVVGGVLGPAWVAFLVGFRARRVGRQNLTRWLTETIRQAREDTTAAIGSALSEFVPELRLRYADILSESLTETQKLINESAAAARADDTERQKQVNILDTELKRITAILNAFRAELAKSQASDVPSPAAAPAS